MEFQFCIILAKRSKVNNKVISDLTKSEYFNKIFQDNKTT
jgi:hypothetical protein